MEADFARQGKFSIKIREGDAFWRGMRIGVSHF
jgi:hypothetical protein